MNERAISVVTDEVADRLRDFVDSIVTLRDGAYGGHELVQLLRRHGLVVIDPMRHRSLIDETVYAGALYRSRHWQDLAEQRAPVPMVLHCPKCGEQHVDKPDPPHWTNPPHRSHLCAQCGWIWRPADIDTVGVEATLTRGRLDGTYQQPEAAAEGTAPESHGESDDVTR